MGNSTSVEIRASIVTTTLVIQFGIDSERHLNDNEATFNFKHAFVNMMQQNGFGRMLK